MDGKYICCMNDKVTKYQYFKGHSAGAVCHSHTLATSSPACGQAKLTSSKAQVLLEDHPLQNGNMTHTQAALETYGTHGSLAPPTMGADSSRQQDENSRHHHK